ncbi:vitamin K-dependent protein Z isoform X2 [Hemicordylus capensis]|uniref:vitamin K-dependent protein Z isoform X2 n=1 Tax=Hemicordylus capensis TaxID=884348 RepID=UPI0023037FAC|nr:vitamin K-dependent protein Z isoform X2 [Hemicordylus capensis]
MGTHNWTRWLVWLVFIFHQAELTVFLSANDANKFIARSKRASYMIVEEILQGNLERECLEERCTYEEAREALEDTEKTNEFWNNYFGGERCSSSPCLHNGVCKDSIRSYTCNCTDGYEGNNCAFAKNECRHEMNEGCQHFCYPELKSYRCSCAQGYKLAEDNKLCIPQDQCACGRSEGHLPMQQNATEKIHRGFPWQVLLLNPEGEMLCGGVLLKTNFVLTTAECALLSPISAVIELVATLSGWKMDGNQSTSSLSWLQVWYLHEDECKQTLNRSLVTREFCGHSHEEAGGVLAGGSFSAVEYKGTWFLTGVLEPWATEASEWKMLVFTKTTRYMMWFKQTMK